jgi:HSP20 family molecular chaperone IbpA
MSNEDEPDRETSKSGSSRTENPLGAALEASLQAGLKSLSDGLKNIAGEDTKDGSLSARPSRLRPSTARKQADQNRSADTTKRRRKTRRRESGSEECLIDTRFTDGEFVVIADMLGASIDDISVGISRKRNQIVISKTNTVVGRVDLPGGSPEMKGAYFKNGILEIYMKSGDTGSLTDSSS